MNKKHKSISKKKAYLAWDKTDFATANEDPPDCIGTGITEGEAMSPEDVEAFYIEEIKSLSVIREEYPEKFEEQYEDFVMDLDYLVSLGKITKEECKKLKNKGDFSFGED